MPWTCVNEHFSLISQVSERYPVFKFTVFWFLYKTPICSLEVGKLLSLKSCKRKGHRLERLLKVSSFCGKFHRYDIRYSSRVGREFDSGTSNANSIVMWFHLFNSSLDIVCTKNVFTCSTDWSWLFWRRANLDRLQVSEFSDSIL